MTDYKVFIDETIIDLQIEVLKLNITNQDIDEYNERIIELLYNTGCDKKNNPASPYHHHRRAD